MTPPPDTATAVEPQGPTLASLSVGRGNLPSWFLQAVVGGAALVALAVLLATGGFTIVLLFVLTMVIALPTGYIWSRYMEGARAAKDRLVDVIRAVQPAFMLSHSSYDPYNTDHMYATSIALECRMIAQAWGHNPGEKVLGAPQLYLFEPHQTEQMGWKPDTFLDITPVWEKKRAAIECMEGQEHLWEYYTRVAQNRANHFKRNSGGQAGGRDCKYAEGFQSVFPRTVDEL